MTTPDLTNIPRRDSSDGVTDITVYVSIGNSDDKLGQGEWCEFISELNYAVSIHAREVYGQWFSVPDAPFQNMVTAFRLHVDEIGPLRAKLAALRGRYQQDSIAWAQAERTEFI